MRKRAALLLVGAALALLALASWATPKDSFIVVRQELKYTISYEEKDLDMAAKPFAQRIMDVDQPAAAKILIEPDADPSRARMTLVEDMRNQTSRVTTFEYLLSPEFRWMSMKLEQKNAHGKTIRREFYNIASPVFKYPQEIITPQSLWLMFPNMPLAPGFKTASFIYMNNILMANAVIEVKARESVIAPAGAFDCWKVSVMPSATDYLGATAGSLVQRFVPSYTIWVEVETPHKIVKYRGLLGQMPSTIPIYFNWELIEYK